MRALLAALIVVALFPAEITDLQESRAPTVAADMLAIREVRRADEVGGLALGIATDSLVVEPPINAREGETAGIFVVQHAAMLQRRAVTWGAPASSSMIAIARGLSRGERLVISDMRAWDQFDQLRLRLR